MADSLFVSKEVTTTTGGSASFIAKGSYIAKLELCFRSIIMIFFFAIRYFLCCACDANGVTDENLVAVIAGSAKNKKSQEFKKLIE